MKEKAMTTDLIKRLEEATEGSRELDVWISFAIGDYVAHDQNDIEKCAREWCELNEYDPGEGYGVPYVSCAADTVGIPRYTTSLDAAMTLVPEGWWFLDLTQDDGGWQAGVIKPGYETGTDGPMATGPIALCIAALKAKDQS